MQSKAGSVTKKLNVGIVFGGRSAEHQVSLQSAKSIIDAIDKTKYQPVLIGITPEGKWLLNDASAYLLNADDPKAISLKTDTKQIALIASEQTGQLVEAAGNAPLENIDVLFPVLHGPYGEDGSIQGLAKLANIPCVGSGIVGSAVGMDKDFTKRLLKFAGLNVAEHVLIHNGKLTDQLIQEIEQNLHYPVFVKPANMGSSIGVSRAQNRAELVKAVSTAAQYDRKILVEQAIFGREIECAILGNDDPKASIPGEIASTHQFYDYDSKYIDEFGAKLSIPADLSAEQIANVQAISKLVFSTLECRGLTRVDVFLTPDNTIYINEVNTLPGFTKISMYPKLWEYSGVKYSELIDQLIQLAIEDFS